MRNYLILFAGLVLLSTWVGSATITHQIQQSLEFQARQRMEKRTIEIVGQLRKQLGDTLVNSDPAQIDAVLSEIGSKNDHFELIDSNGQLWFDSFQGRVAPKDESNKAEFISFKDRVTGFQIRENRIFSTRKLQGPVLSGLIRIGEPYGPISDILGSVQRFAWIFAVISMFIAVALMLMFARQSLSPLNEFAAAARMIGVGQYNSVPALHGRRDNWAVLAEAYRHMQQELEKREVNILENSSRLQAVLSSMVEGVLAIDSAGQIMLANRAACDMLQMAHADVLDRNFLEIFRVPELSEAIATTQQQRSFTQCEFQTRDLPRKIISARVSVLNDTLDAKIPRIAVVLHDVTDLRQLETLRRDFVANVSHELKTPLASIKAYAETLKLGAINDGEKNMQFVEHIEAQADLLNEQIQDLLQLARVESGQKNWEIVSISINEIAQHCIDQFRSEAASRKIAVTLNRSTEDLVAKADKDGVRTILSNLISNALHYTAAGGSVEIAVSRSKSFVKVEVVDDGIGISPDHHARIFERFYRVDKARSREHGGTGLGLAIVKHLCQAFGGSVELESSLGKGSRFIVKLPNAKK